jgi:hypothetical protein
LLVGGTAIYRTSDGGASWAESSLQAPAGLTFDTLTAFSNQVLWGTAYTTFSAADSCAPRFDACLYAVRSTDSGAHWTIVKLPPT